VDRIRRMFQPRLTGFVAAAGLLFGTLAQAQIIDFEGIGTIQGPPYDVISQGFTVQQTMFDGTPEPIIRPAELSPNGTDLYAICGFCAASTGCNLYS